MPKYLRDKRSPIPSSEKASRVMSSIRGKNTKPELILRKMLWEQHIRGYRLHWRIPGKPDIAFVKKKIAIFVNGCYWHRCPKCDLPIPKSNSVFWEEKLNKNVSRDSSKIHLLKTSGWKVLVFWECEIKENQDALAEKIQILKDYLVKS